MSIRQTCTSHCSTCGRHFHGDAAFDCHRRFDCPEAAQAKDWSRRVCADPALDPRMEVWTVGGECRISGGTLLGVTIWRMKMSESQLRSIASFREARKAQHLARDGQPGA